MIKMNQAKFKQFSEAYKAGLHDAVTMFPHQYAIGEGETPVEYASKTAEKILEWIVKNPYGVNYTGTGFKKACTLLQIKHTRKAILEYLEHSK